MNAGELSTRTIVRVPRSCRLQAAAELMRQNHVGALIVTEDAPDDGHAIGILTDRDIVLNAVAEDIAPNDAMAVDVMTEGLATVDASADLHAVMTTMREHGVRRLVVTAEDGTLAGIASFDDVIDALAAQFTAAAGTGREAALATEVEALAGVVRSERLREIETQAELEAELGP
jgi:CBS domain-containing protein